ncbi:uncharacterized protein LOC115418211 [Sphaeramia orbicularis]|uniref:uncharacterized protein LOC115418211 n=1 Tax=Sphaeramia orbicularis TaxID=375764 RepID=UPI00117F7F75|nr:uncharacterized protein LOC115418211 [Sphaeramia orbicularis]
MEGSVSLEDTFSEEEFQKILVLIGGKERIYLVSDACPGPEGAEEEAGILQDFIRDMFDNSLWTKPQQSQSCPTEDQDHPADHHQISDPHVRVRSTGEEVRASPAEGGGGGGGGRTDSHRPRTATRRTNVCSKHRTIDCPVIIFMFTQTFLRSMSSHTCLKEILKDVKARTKRATVPHPALIGLIGTAAESAETQRCAQTLEHLMRSVFCRHAAETIWVSWFCPRTEAKVRSIKMNTCRVIYAAQTADNTRDRGNLLLWPFQCLFRSHRGRPRRHANNSTTSWQRGDTQCTEEGIPLKTNSLSVGPHVDGASARKDN